MANVQSDGAPTREIAEWVAGLRADSIDPIALRWARHCLLDWLAVTVAGAREPLVDLLVAEAMADGAIGPVPLVGRTETLSPSWAVLVNGAASHALDYDDVNTAMHGHPTVAVLPAVLAAGADRNLDDVLRAFVVGYEVACLVGEMTGDGHYDKGWHATGTVGTFGAAAGVAWIMGLDADQTAHAFGQAATMAAGLKAMFGTMAKPFHAGRAAQSGFLATRLAAQGWTTRDDGLECGQGFWDTQAPDHVPFGLSRQSNQPFQITHNLFKYHAACYMTHSTIEASQKIGRSGVLKLDEIKSVRVQTARAHLKICNIENPDTGLKVKFSLRHLAAMGLSGHDTAAIGSYSDACARHSDLVSLREKVVVEPQETESSLDTNARVVVELLDGRTFAERANVGVPATDIDEQEARLNAKFQALTEPWLGQRAAAARRSVLTNTTNPTELLKQFQAT